MSRDLRRSGKGCLDLFLADETVGHAPPLAQAVEPDVLLRRVCHFPAPPHHDTHALSARRRNAQRSASAALDQHRTDGKEECTVASRSTTVRCCGRSSGTRASYVSTGHRIARAQADSSLFGLAHSNNSQCWYWTRDRETWYWRCRSIRLEALIWGEPGRLVVAEPRSTPHSSRRGCIQAEFKYKKPYSWDNLN